MNVWGIKSLEERKKKITTQAAAAAASPTDWNDATHSAAVAASTSSFYFFIFKALTLSGARADDHLWPSCWDCIGFLRGTQQKFFFLSHFWGCFFFGVFFSFFSVFTQDSRYSPPEEKKKKSRDPTFNHL